MLTIAIVCCHYCGHSVPGSISKRDWQRVLCQTRRVCRGNLFDANVIWRFCHHEMDNSLPILFDSVLGCPSDRPQPDRGRFKAAIHISIGLHSPILLSITSTRIMCLMLCYPTSSDSIFPMRLISTRIDTRREVVFWGISLFIPCFCSMKIIWAKVIRRDR